MPYHDEATKASKRQAVKLKARGARIPVDFKVCQPCLPAREGLVASRLKYEKNTRKNIGFGLRQKTGKNWPKNRRIAQK